MSDFSWDDYENDNDDLFGNHDEGGDNEFGDSIRRFQRLMFINDLEMYKSAVVPLDPTEFIAMLGEPTDEDLEILTQILIKDIHTWKTMKVIDKWGKAWVQYLLDFNEREEEYELCARFKEVIDTK